MNSAIAFNVELREVIENAHANIELADAVSALGVAAASKLPQDLEQLTMKRNLLSI